MKIAFIIPDGVGVRNYLYAGLTELILKDHEVVLVSTIQDEQSRSDICDEIGCSIPFQDIPVYRETAKVKFLREVSTFSRLLHNRAMMKNPTLMLNWSPKRDTFTKRLFFGLVETVGRYVARRYSSILNIERKLDKALRESQCYSECKNLLTHMRPDVILCTHQRAINAVPLVLAAMDLGIRTISAIYSWDNLPKARLLVKADEYLVWSDYMKDELETYYPEEKVKPIHVTGTPQFEFYSDENRYWSREAFCEELGLDCDRKIICYSGGDIRTSPYDQEYLTDLALAIKTMPEADRPQILLRRCPVDFSDRYDQALEQHGDIIRVSHPKWKQGNSTAWTLTYPLYADVELLINTALHCDAVYNVGSTMAHDFYMFDKPAVYANYDPPHVENWSVKMIYEFQHFRSMPSKDCVFWVHAKEQISKVIHSVLNDPEKHIAERKRWLFKIIGPEPEKASNRIYSVLGG